VIAGSGFGGHSNTRDRVAGRCRRLLQPAQAAAAKGAANAAYVDTRDCFRPREQSPGVGDIEHFFSNAETYFLIGDAMGQAMKELRSDARKAK
jgi:alpha-galactosidase